MKSLRRKGGLFSTTKQISLPLATLLLLCYHNFVVITMEMIIKDFNSLSLLELYEILSARSEIFIMEQGMRCQEMDGIDIRARHYYLKDKDKLVAYLRAFYEDEDKGIVRIGRVISMTHGIGLGAEIMNRAIADIEKNMKCTAICLDAQTQAVGFYKKFGFNAVSDEFLEEGVLHVKMERKLSE